MIIWKNSSRSNCKVYKRQFQRIIKRQNANQRLNYGSLVGIFLLNIFKRHPNGYVECRGKAGQLGRSIHERAKDFPHYATEFGHLEADTVQGKKHQGAGMTLTER